MLPKIRVPTASIEDVQAIEASAIERYGEYWASVPQAHQFLRDLVAATEEVLPIEGTVTWYETGRGLRLILTLGNA